MKNFSVDGRIELSEEVGLCPDPKPDETMMDEPYVPIPSGMTEQVLCMVTPRKDLLLTPQLLGKIQV